MTPKQIFQQHYGLSRCVSRVRNEHGARQYCVIDPAGGELGRWRDSAAKAWLSACCLDGLTNEYGAPYAQSIHSGTVNPPSAQLLDALSDQLARNIQVD